MTVENMTVGNHVVLTQGIHIVMANGYSYRIFKPKLKSSKNNVKTTISRKRKGLET